MSAIQTLFIQHKNSIDSHVINEIKLNDPCIEFVAITSEPEFILEMFAPGGGGEVLVISKNHFSPDGQPLYQNIIDQNEQHIPIILIDNTLSEILPPKSSALPAGVFMAIPAQKDSSISEMTKTNNYLRQSIIYTGNSYRRLHYGQPCCKLHNSRVFQLHDSSIFLKSRSNYLGKEEAGPTRPELLELPPATLEELLDDKDLWPELPHICQPSLLAIGVSTGGPEALKTLLQELPSNFPAPILLVQHINANFIESFHDSLQRVSSLKIELAESSMICRPGTIYIPSTKVHMGISRDSSKHNIVLKLAGSYPQLPKHVPSVGYLFNSIADSNLAASSVAIIMTGMGEDGAVEIGRIKKAGGITLAQDQASSSIFGMPKVAIQLGNVHRAVPLKLLASLLKHLFRVSRRG